MKTASGPPQSIRRRPPAWVCGLINLAAFPGLGTVLAGRRGGYSPAIIMVGGFVLVMGYMLWYLGAVVPYLQGVLADHVGVQASFILPLLCYGYIIFYGLVGARAPAAGTQGG